MNKLTTTEVTYTVEINDNGDVIYIPAGDLVFMSQYEKMIENIQSCAADVGAIKTSEDTTPLIEILIGISKKAMAEIDAVFGADTCTKATGCKIPSPDILIELVNNITELIEKFTGERFAKIEKKYANRAQRRASKR